MNVCSKCGKKLKKDDKVCSNCGKKVKLVKSAAKGTKTVVNNTEKEVKKVVEKVNEPKANNKVLIILTWILGLLLPPVGLVLYLVWRKTKKEYAKNAGVGALVATCIWAFLGLTLLIDTKGKDKVESTDYQIYNADTQSI